MTMPTQFIGPAFSCRGICLFRSTGILPVAAISASGYEKKAFFQHIKLRMLRQKQNIYKLDQ